MIFVDKSNFTSNPIRQDTVGFSDVYLTIAGPGSVSIEFLQEDSVWRSFPESSFAGPGAFIISIPKGVFRCVVSGGPTTIEVRT